MIDHEKLDGSDQDENLEIHVGRNSRIMKSILGLSRAAWTSVCGNITILLSQERPDHDLQDRVSPFSCNCRAVVEHVDSVRSTPVLRLPVAFTGAGFSGKTRVPKNVGSAAKSLHNSTRYTLASMLHVHDSLPRPIP